MGYIYTTGAVNFNPVPCLQTPTFVFPLFFITFSKLLLRPCRSALLQRSQPNIDVFSNFFTCRKAEAAVVNE